MCIPTKSKFTYRHRQDRFPSLVKWAYSANPPSILPDINGREFFFKTSGLHEFWSRGSGAGLRTDSDVQRAQGRAGFIHTFVLTRRQVRSQTQFYSVDFSLSRIGVKKCLFYKRTIKVCSSCYFTASWDLQDYCSTPNWVLPSLKLWKQRTRRVKGPWKALCQLKKALFEGLRRRRGSCWEERRRKVFSLTRGNWFPLRANQ